MHECEKHWKQICAGGIKKQTSCQMQEFFMLSGLKGEIDWYVQTFKMTFSSELFPPAVWNWLCIHDAKWRCNLYACCQCERITSRPNSGLDWTVIIFFCYRKICVINVRLSSKICALKSIYIYIYNIHKSIHKYISIILNNKVWVLFLIK